MTHVSRTHRVALDWLYDRINLDPKTQIKYIDTKNQLADILTEGNFTHDEWNHLLNLLNISHFSSTAWTAAMEKRTQQGSGEEPARTPSLVFSSTSSNPGPRVDIKILKDLFQLTIERENLWKSQDQIIYTRIMVDLGLPKSGKVELQSTIDRGNLKQLLGIYCKKMPLIVRNLLGGNAHSARYGETIHDGSGKPETVNHQEEANSEKIVMGSDAAEFLDTVKDQVRNRQKRMSNVAGSRAFNNMRNVHGYDLKCGDIHGKEFLTHSKCCQVS